MVYAMKFNKQIKRLTLCAAAVAFCALNLAPIYGRNFMEDYASFIGEDDYRKFYERHGVLPCIYESVDCSANLVIEFEDTNLVRSKNNKLVYHVTPHFTSCPYMIVDSVVPFRYEREEESYKEDQDSYRDSLRKFQPGFKQHGVQITDVSGTFDSSLVVKRHHAIPIKRLDLCVGDTIFANNQMTVLWINGHYLKVRGTALIGKVFMNSDWRRELEHHRMKSNKNPYNSLPE